MCHECHEIYTHYDKYGHSHRLETVQANYKKNKILRFRGCIDETQFAHQTQMYVMLCLLLVLL